MVGVQKSWSVTAASNSTADSNINYAEGQTPASLNDSARAGMAAIKAWANQITGAKTSGGSANAQTLTSDAAGAISTAYAAGMAFVFKAGFTNSATATFNVDGVGAKTIKKGGAQSALAANDIVAGGVYMVVYEASGDCFILLNPETGQTSAGFQPLDATLTALAALSWSSGNALVQFTAADTVSLTLTPSVSTLTLSSNLTLAAGTVGAPILRKTGDTDTGLWFPSDDQVALGAANGAGDFRVFSGGAFMNVGVFLIVDGAANAPSIAFLNDQDCGWYRIGTNNWAGAVGGSKFVDIGTALIDFTVDVRSNSPASSETTGTLSAVSANKVVTCTGNITLDDDIFAARNAIVFDPGTSNRTFTRSAGLAMYVNGTDSASATLAANQLGTVYWRDTDTAILSGAFT